MVLKTLESPLDWKKFKPVHPKGNQSWIFIGRTDDEAEVLILWPHYVKNWLIEKHPDAGKGFFFFFFNWRLITLQYCSGFCHTLTWISHGRTCVPHPEPPSHLAPHPIGRKRRGWLRMRWLDGIFDSMDMSLSKPWELVSSRHWSLACWSPWGPKQ